MQNMTNNKKRMAVATALLAVLVVVAVEWSQHQQEQQEQQEQLPTNDIVYSMPILETGQGLLVRSKMTADELAQRLRPGLKEFADTFVFAERALGIDATFLAAVATLESGGGTSHLAQSKNNLFGWTNADGTYMDFETKQQCILYCANKIKEQYLTNDGQYFSGYTVEAVNQYYNGSKLWEDVVTEIMEGLER